MKVELISFTTDALTLLLRTKGTRLAHDDPATWPEEKRLAELAYMKDTIKSSWEFVDFVFRVSDVSRAFTHQYVRTRAGAYAQESQRTVDARDNGAIDPETYPSTVAEALWHKGIADSFARYAKLVDNGMPPQDARGVLPTATSTSIIAKFNLRTLHEMAISRLCVRTQGEYQNVFREMKSRVVEVYPWAEPFIRVGCAQNGICVFPRYKECPIGQFTYNNVASPDAAVAHAQRVETIVKLAENVHHEARPVAKAGRTM